jgi:hypothetical protein
LERSSARGNGFRSERDAREIREFRFGSRAVQWATAFLLFLLALSPPLDGFAGRSIGHWSILGPARHEELRA